MSKIEKACEVLIKTGENKFVKVGIAKLELVFGWHEFGKTRELVRAKLKETKIMFNKDDIIWEAPPNLWVSED